MRRTTRFPALPALALLAGLAACGAGDAPGANEAETGPMTAVEEPDAPAPEAKAGAITVDSGTMELEFKRFDAPAGFPLQFATYVPEDMIVETATAPGGRDAVRVVANFGGQRNDNAFLWVLFHPPGTGEDVARRIAVETALTRGTNEEVPASSRRFPWSIAEYAFSYRPGTGKAHVGTIAMGHRGERYFHLVIEYPDDLRGEFLPRVERILEDWRWKAGGGIGDARSR